MNTNQNLTTNLITKVVSLLLSLNLTACSLASVTKTTISETQPTLAPNTPTFTATASQTPTNEPTATIEPSPTVEPTKSPEQLLLEFKESAEYKQGLQDYLNAMNITENQITISEEIKLISGEEHQLLVVTCEYCGSDTEQSRFIGTNDIPLFILDQNSQEELTWRKIDWHDVANILIGVGIDIGDQNHNDKLYLERAFEGNLIFVTGGLMHASIEWGRKYVPFVLNEYHNEFGDKQVTIGGASLFELHDEIPKISSEEEMRKYMRERTKEVLEILEPFVKKHDDQILIAISNETFAGFGGSENYADWVDHRFYQIFGKRWIIEAYLAFEDVRNEMGLPRENFIVYINDYGIELPGKKSNFFKQELIKIKQSIAKELNISYDEVQLEIGLQCHNMYDIPTDHDVFRFMQTDLGRQQMADNINKLSGETGSKIFFTEVTSGEEPVEFMINFLSMAKMVNNLEGVNIWDALRTNSGTLGGETIWDKKTYQPTEAYYAMLAFLLSLH